MRNILQDGKPVSKDGLFIKNYEPGNFKKLKKTMYLDNQEKESRKENETMNIIMN